MSWRLTRTISSQGLSVKQGLQQGPNNSLLITITVGSECDMLVISVWVQVFATSVMYGNL